MEPEQSIPSLHQEEQYQKLQKQIQFYFSDANLLTDPNLANTIRKSHRSWVPLTYLFQCRKIRSIMKQLNIGLRGRRRKIAKIVKNSEYLKVRDWKVKRNHPFSAKRQKQRMVYFEAKMSNDINKIMQEVEDFCSQQNIIISSKRLNSWGIIVSQSKQQSQQLERYLRINGESLGLSKILNGTQWEQKERKFEQIRKKMQKHMKNKEGVLAIMRQGMKQG